MKIQPGCSSTLKATYFIATNFIIALHSFENALMMTARQGPHPITCVRVSSTFTKQKSNKVEFIVCIR